MTTTPPPQAKRAFTPPAPLHGAKHDSYEPYSPRRSSRINIRTKIMDSPSSPQESPDSLRQAANRITNQPISREPKATFSRTLNQTFSPPCSPTSSALPSSLGRRKRGSNHAEASGRPVAERAPTDPDTDNETLGFTSSTRKSGLQATMAALPTPAKTPRKRGIQQDAFDSTARVLFPGRTMHPDDIMPSPRKTRKNKQKDALTLESFKEASQLGDDIEIYTDSKERVPEADQSEDNPFMTKRGGRASRSQKESGVASKSQTAADKEMEEAVARGEGMIYVFRGKRILRRFDDAAFDDELADDPDQHDIRRQAGEASKRPFTRSSIQPRLLFPPPKEPTPEAEEEAETDIETETALNATPTKQSFRPTTPPPSKRKRGVAKQLTPDSSPLGLDKVESLSQPKKQSPFDSWQRTKSSSRTVSGKRTGDTMQAGGKKFRL